MNSYCARIVDGRLPQLIPDTSQLEQARNLPITRQLSIGAYMGVPIRFSDGHLFGTFCCFDPHADSTLNERDLQMLRMVADLSARQLETMAKRKSEAAAVRQRIQWVLDHRDFQMVFQPIQALSSGQIVGYEALSRFSSQPYQPPDVWFREADSVGLRESLEITVIEKALEALPCIPIGQYLALNVSPRTLLDPRFTRCLSGQSLDRLMLEVTEHDVIDDYEALSVSLMPLKKAGVKLAIDDAGAGYASFRHILMLEPDVIKIDRSITSGIDQRASSRALTQALMGFSSSIGSILVAEGIETLEELSVLRELGVNKGQGYLLGKPSPLGHWLES